MLKKILFPAWGVLFALCAGLGFLPEPEGADQVCCVVMAALFFVPPAVIVYLSWKEQDWETVRLVRNLAFGSLVVTLATLVGNFATLAAPTWAGDLMYAVLVIVSAPMICSQMWIISLALWAALMWTCILLLSKKK